MVLVLPLLPLLPLPQAFAEQPVVGEREHILLFLSNVSLPAKTPANPRNSSSGSAGAAADGPIELASAMTWVGYSPGLRRSSARALTSPDLSISGSSAGSNGGDVSNGGYGSNGGDVSSLSAGNEERVALDCGHEVAGVVIGTSLPKDVLQLQQLVLTRLPQGPGAMVPTTFNAVPAALFTIMLWSFARYADVHRTF